MVGFLDQELINSDVSREVGVDEAFPIIIVYDINSIRWLSPGNVKTVESKSALSPQVATYALVTGRSKLSERKLRQQLKMANSLQSASYTNAPKRGLSEVDVEDAETDADESPSKRPRTARA
ncbi:hypothetical protein B0T18DRAFT_392662 [Schizothecium vesticola]|uniref:Uncharacterized protein n=1 Tax=Schizothecium vesticola TaxID=314040 RepID=A0AA40K315_9PEZI|nr:hypothetical protein B0T18DRAFT_392662 [Schizothecium vesticola]